MNETLNAKMDPLNLNELAQIATTLQSLVGAQLQECVQSASEAGLGFYHDRAMVWLWFDLSPLRPVVLQIPNSPPNRKKLARPLTLFIKSRFVGRRLESVRVDLARGRILILSFFRAADEKVKTPLTIEAHLIPHATNLVAIDGKATVAEFKPKELPQQVFTEQRPDAKIRSWDEIFAQWRSLQSASVAKQASAGVTTEATLREKKYKKAVEKKRAALDRMNEELIKKTSGPHREIGEWLKANSLHDAPAEWREYIDTEKNLAWNIENLFHRAKENERKSEGTKARMALVARELAELEKLGSTKFDLPQKGSAKPKEGLLERAEARGRRHQVAPDIDAYIGKSAADNLAILRKAQAFDFWLHLRDYPGAHAILRRTRGRNVTDAEFQEAGRWVFEQSLGLRAKDMKGERFDLLIVECRYVRPIKGDKLGRVNYTNDRAMTIRY